MILYYKKITGDIVGTTNGRIHNEDHLKMWIGDKAETERLIIQWEAKKFYSREGVEIDKDAKDADGNSLVFAADFEPQHEQKELFVMLDKTPDKIYDYRVDLETKLLVLK